MPGGVRATSTRRRSRACARKIADVGELGRAAQEHLRRARGAAGPLHRRGRVRPERRRAPGPDRASPGRASAVAWDLRVQFPPAALRPVRRAHGDARQRRRGGARHRALRRDRRVAAADRAHPRGAAGGRYRRRRCRDAPDNAFGIGWVEGWRGEVLIALETRRRQSHPAAASARSVVAELAAARARGARQHRSGLSAHQQVVQPVVQRA